MIPAPGAGSEGTKKKRKRRRPANRAPQTSTTGTSTSGTDPTPSKKPARPYAKRVDEVSWFPLAEIVDRLAYPDEKKLIARSSELIT